MWIPLLIGFGIAAVLIGLVMIAARKFARQREREGTWNADGPIHPSDPPPDWLLPKAWSPTPPTIESEPDDQSDDFNSHKPH